MFTLPNFHLSSFFISSIIFGVQFLSESLGVNMPLLIIFLSFNYILGVVSGFMLASYHQEMAKYTNTYKKDSLIPTFYIITGLLPFFQLNTVLMYLSHLSEIDYFNEVKEKGLKYVPLPRRETIERMGQ